MLRDRKEAWTGTCSAYFKVLYESRYSFLEDALDLVDHQHSSLR